MVNRGLVLLSSRVRPFMCMSVTPAVPYLLLGLQDVQWAVRNSRGARKLARTPHVKKKIYTIIIINNSPTTKGPHSSIYKPHHKCRTKHSPHACISVSLSIYSSWTPEALISQFTQSINARQAFSLNSVSELR